MGLGDYHAVCVCVCVSLFEILNKEADFMKIINKNHIIRVRVLNKAQ
jgi:hypothetical protein